VTIDGEESASIINIGIDQKNAAADLMRHVLKRGHQRLAILALEPDTKPSGSEISSIVVQRRLEGFQAVLKDAGLSITDTRVFLQNCKGSIQSGYESAYHILSLDQRPTAIVAMSDITAIGAMIAARELGLEIPEDVAVAGFDDIPESVLVSPRLTTIHQPDRDKGAEAARMVINMLNGSSGQHIKLPYQLIVRESA